MDRPADPDYRDPEDGMTDKEAAEAYLAEIDKRHPWEIANDVLRSEDFMWLMCGGDPAWLKSHIEALRPLWDEWLAAGGKPYGRV